MKKYQIIYADPPWNIQLIFRRVRPQQLNMPYKRMTLNEIKSLSMKNIVDPTGCHLFLWTTHKFLPKSFEVIEAWGFKYHCVITWNKTYGFTPFSFMWSTEFCLYGQLKNKWIKPKHMGLKTLITEKPREHSRKPIAMYELIEQYATGNKIELFARPQTPFFPKRDGWDVWGEEVESDIEL